MPQYMLNLTPFPNPLELIVGECSEYSDTIERNKKGIKAHSARSFLSMWSKMSV